MENKLKIYIAEDHQPMTETWIELLQNYPEIEIVGNSSTVQEVCHILKYTKIDLLILDLVLPLNNINQYSLPLGYDVLDFIKQNEINTKVLVISSHEEPAFILKARSKGAKGYLNKKATKLDILNAIRSIGFDRKECFDSKSISKMIAKINSNGIILSVKEREILNYISEGFTSKSIAEKLCLSHETIKEYRDGLIRKFEAKNSAHLIKIASENGYLIEY